MTAFVHIGVSCALAEIYLVVVNESFSECVHGVFVVFCLRGWGSKRLVSIRGVLSYPSRGIGEFVFPFIVM